MPTTPELVGMSSLKNSWILYYIMHGNPNALFKFFISTDTLPVVVERSKEHCRIMGYRWLYVTPLFIDMAADEAVRLGGGPRGL